MNRKEDAEINPPSSGSAPKWPQQPEVGWTEDGFRVLLVGLLRGCRSSRPCCCPSSTALPGC